MSSPPPWARLKVQAKSTTLKVSESSVSEWVEPPVIQLEKHFKFYRDLLRSTEKVELSLAHSGKSEVLDSFDDPGEPPIDRQSTIRPFHTILVPLRFGQDPRDEFVMADGRVGTRPEYLDASYLKKLVLTRETDSIISGSEKPSPSPSPGSRITSESPMRSDSHTIQSPKRVTPPPPPTAPPNRPPPPKAPPPHLKEDQHPSKKQRSLH